ncbi:hypothetical protein [Hungatella sp.]|uniref:hypothetical protein n=1 Tax=Hungatella sp. TaxID=2613924 RepID=UPI003994138B
MTYRDFDRAESPNPYGFTVSTSLALVVFKPAVALMCCRSINAGNFHGVFAAAGIFASFF